MFTRHIWITALAVVACAVPASATISYYTSLSTFEADNVSAQTISFDGLGLNSLFLSANLSDFTFSSTSSLGANLTVLGNPGGSWPASPADVLAQTGQFANGSIVIQLPSNVYGIALFASYTLGGDDVDVNLTAGSAFPTVLLNATPASPVFFGARSDQPISSLVITHASPGNFGQPIDIGSFLFDTVAGSDSGGGGGGGGGGDMGDAPEPASLFLIGAGLIAITMHRRRSAR